MRYVKWTFVATLAAVIIGFLHYTLPQHDVVRIVGTYQERQTGLINRDVQFIQAVKANGKEVVYRNEDTGWSWPPYFKFDTANLLARAQDMISTSENPKWAVVTHYGWRNIYVSAFPNAVNIKPVAGPDVTIIPWFNIAFFVALAILIFMLRRMWLQFRERALDPALEDVGEAWEGVEGRAGHAADEVRGFWGRFKGRASREAEQRRHLRIGVRKVVTGDRRSA